MYAAILHSRNLYITTSYVLPLWDKVIFLSNLGILIKGKKSIRFKSSSFSLQAGLFEMSMYTLYSQKQNFDPISFEQ